MVPPRTYHMTHAEVDEIRQRRRDFLVFSDRPLGAIVTRRLTKSGKVGRKSVAAALRQTDMIGQKGSLWNVILKMVCFDDEFTYNAIRCAMPGLDSIDRHDVKDRVQDIKGKLNSLLGGVLNDLLEYTDQCQHGDWRDILSCEGYAVKCRGPIALIETPKIQF